MINLLFIASIKNVFMESDNDTVKQSIAKNGNKGNLDNTGKGVLPYCSLN